MSRHRVALLTGTLAFYLAIVFSFGYWGYYHILEAGPLQMDEYRIEMAQAEAAAITAREAVEAFAAERA